MLAEKVVHRRSTERSYHQIVRIKDRPEDTHNDQDLVVRMRWRFSETQTVSIFARPKSKADTCTRSSATTTTTCLRIHPSFPRELEKPTKDKIYVSVSPSKQLFICSTVVVIRKKHTLLESVCLPVSFSQSSTQWIILNWVFSESMRPRFGHWPCAICNICLTSTLVVFVTHAGLVMCIP